jgi:ribosomal protein S18 acetylase RimI-like enzyme
VQTHPEHRRRGLAGALAVRASEIARSELAVQTLVIAADPDDVAIRLYRALGFADSELQVQLERTPDQATP